MRNDVTMYNVTSLFIGWAHAQIDPSDDQIQIQLGNQYLRG